MVVIAAVVMGEPLVGELEMSLPPWVVPILAEVELAKVGVKLTVAPKSGLVDDALIEAVAANTTFTVVVAVFVGLSCDVAVTVTLPAVAGAVHVLVLHAPALDDQLMLFVTPPVAVVVNIVVLFTVFVGAEGVMAFTTTVCGVTVTELSTFVPAALVARSQKIVGAVKAAVVTCVPLVGELEMSLAPGDVPTSADAALLNVGVRLTVAP